jgi:hypothetical protein
MDIDKEITKMNWYVSLIIIIVVSIVATIIYLGINREYEYCDLVKSKYNDVKICGCVPYQGCYYVLFDDIMRK